MYLELYTTVAGDCICGAEIGKAHNETTRKGTSGGARSPGAERENTPAALRTWCQQGPSVPHGQNKIPIADTHIAPGKQR